MKLKALLLSLGLAATSLSALADQVTVFAAASMTNAMQSLAEGYKKVNPHDELIFSFGSSSTLAKQIEQGAPANLFVSANTKWMKHLSDKDLTVKETEKVLAGNALVLIATKDWQLNSVDVSKDTWFKGLDGVFLALGDPDHVPAGIYAKEALTKLKTWPALENHIARTKDVRASLALVEKAETPYGVVYSTDAKQAKNVKVVATFPADSHKAIEYPVAILKEGDNPASRAFLTYLASDEAKAVLQGYGFTTK
ncbi:molybdate ABC transporter substrate-binding protein [Pasteurellaceae bacterium RH1A]|nr:molybdate ABC transporter substrate-binding protein [Pasteurellaceae bacterium RH1A]